MKCEACGHVNERRKRLPDENFAQFWKLYPRKIGKFLANKVWKNIKGDEELFKKIMAAVERQRRSTDWLKDNGAYIPHPSTWLNQRRWDDEVPESGQIVRLSPTQNPETQAKAQAAKDRLEAIKEREFEKREKVRLAQERDDLRSRKMLEAAGDNDQESWEVPKLPAIPVEITRCVDENGNKWIEELERQESAD